MSVPLTEFSIRVATALGLGIAIGLERQWHNRTAGLRTNALVSLGAAIFASLALLLSTETSPTRMAAQIVSGIGFLGAGLILREGNHVRGLNTAATLWCSAAVGTLCGSGFPKEATVGSICVIAAHLILRPVSLQLTKLSNVSPEPEQTVYKVKVICASALEQRVRASLLQMALSSDWTMRSLHSGPVASTNESESGTEITAELITLWRQDNVIERLVSQLGLEPDVSSVSWQLLGLTLEGE